MNATVCLRRCLFLYGAWPSQSAYDARMVNMAVGKRLGIESINHDIKLYVIIAVFFVDLKPPFLV